MAKVTLAVLILAFVWVFGKKLDKSGLIILTDEAFSASVVLKEGLNSPDGVLVKDGLIYLADEGGSSVKTWSQQDGVKTLSDSRSGLQSPEDLVIDAAGNIFFTDDAAGAVWAMDVHHEVRLLAGKAQGLVSPEGLVLAPDGALLVGDGGAHAVFRVTTDGAVALFLGNEYGIRKPESMAFDDHGNLYIADNEANVLYLLDRDRKLHKVISTNEEFSPESICYSNCALFISDSSNGKLYRLSANEELRTVAIFGGKLSKVQGVTVDRQGDLYLTVQAPHDTGYLIKLSR